MALKTASDGRSGATAGGGAAAVADEHAVADDVGQGVVDLEELAGGGGQHLECLGQRRVLGETVGHNACRRDLVLAAADEGALTAGQVDIRRVLDCLG